MQEVKYEWKPIHCSNCGGMGHDTEKCKRLLGTRKEWVPKVRQPTAEKTTDSEGFVTPREVQSHNKVPSAPAPVENSNLFQALNDDAATQEVVLLDPGIEALDDPRIVANTEGESTKHAGGGEPPISK